MTKWKNHPLVGHLRIDETDLLDRERLDLCGPVRIVISANGAGKVTFGALEARLDIANSHNDISFSWFACEDGDQIEGEGDTEIPKCGSLLINFGYRNGEEANLIAG